MLQLLVVVLFLQSAFGNRLYGDEEINALKGAFTGYYEQFGSKLNVLIRQRENATQVAIDELRKAATTKLQSTKQTIQKLLQDFPKQKECITAVSNQLLEYTTDGNTKLQTYLQERISGYEKLRGKTVKDFRDGISAIKQTFEDMRGCNTFECVEGNTVECIICNSKKQIYADVKADVNWLYTSEMEIRTKTDAFIQFVDDKLKDARECYAL